MRRLVMIVVLGVLAVLVPQSGAQAASFVVNNLGDGPDANTSDPKCATAQGVCTLRAAIQQAKVSPGSDIITVPTGTITVATPLPTDSAMSIVGAGAGATIIKGTGTGVMWIHNVTGEMLLQDLAIAGSSTSGTLISQFGGAPKTTLNRVRVANNAVTSNSGVTAGGISVTTGEINLIDSSMTGNTVSVPLSGSYTSGLSVSGAGVKARVENSTIANNTASGQSAYFGGFSVGPGAEALVRYSTIVGNSVQGTFQSLAPTIYNDGTLTIENSVIGDAVPFGSQPVDNCIDMKPITFTGKNVISDESCGLANANRIIAPLRLGPASSNSKGTVSRVPEAGSAVINLLDCSGSDQRGVARPQGVRCDAGAVEALADPAVSLSAAAQSVPAGGEVSFVATVTNNGPDRLSGLVLAVAAGNGTFTTAVQCTVGAELSCPLSLAPGASATVQFSVRAIGPGPMPVTATLRNLLPDPVPGNNTSSVTVTVPGGTTPPAACSVTKKGTKKADRLRGTAAGDRLLGRGGNDRLKGLAGDDCLNGGKGKDRMVAGAGNDTISARDGQRDVIRCGTGTDTVVADKRDKIAKDCERRKRR